MINFGDLSPLANVNVTEPIAKANETSTKLFIQGIREVEANVAAENAAYKQVFDEIMKTGKVEFTGGSAKAFQEKYKTEKQNLLNEMKKYSSVQSFLNNGGYDKIAEFKDNIERSEEFQNGIRSYANDKIVQNLLANGVSMKDIKFGSPDNYSKWVKGEAPVLDFQGTYNTKPITLDSFAIQGKRKDDVSFDEEGLRKQMQLLGYSEARIEEAVKYHNEQIAQNKTGFLQEKGDPNFEARMAQIDATKAIAEENARVKQAIENAKIQQKREELAQEVEMKKLKFQEKQKTSNFANNFLDAAKANNGVLNLDQNYTGFKPKWIGKNEDKKEYLLPGTYKKIGGKETFVVTSADADKYKKAGPAKYHLAGKHITQEFDYMNGKNIERVVLQVSDKIDYKTEAGQQLLFNLLNPKEMPAQQSAQPTSIAEVLKGLNL